MVVELAEEIRQVVHLSEAKLEFDEHFFDVIDVVAGFPPLSTELLEQSLLLFDGDWIRVFLVED